MPGGRGPKRVLNAVSPALALSASPATPARENLKAPMTELCRRTWAAHVDAEWRRLLRRGPHFDLDLMDHVATKGVIGIKGHTWDGIVMGINGGIGMQVIKGISAAAIQVSAERLMVNVGHVEPMEPARVPLELARRRRLVQAETCAAPCPRLVTYAAITPRMARSRHGKRRNAPWSSVGTLAPLRGARIASGDRPLKRS